MNMKQYQDKWLVMRKWSRQYVWVDERVLMFAKHSQAHSHLVLASRWLKWGGKKATPETRQVRRQTE
jgi:hypothetical protein